MGHVRILYCEKVNQILFETFGIMLPNDLDSISGLVAYSYWANGMFQIIRNLFSSP